MAYIQVASQNTSSSVNIVVLCLLSVAVQYTGIFGTSLLALVDCR